MGHRKVINRMRKAATKSSEAMKELAEAGRIGALKIPFSSEDAEIHNICVEAYSVHVKIWNQLHRYINQLSKKRSK